MQRHRDAVWIALALSVAACGTPAKAQFAGPYAPSQWTLWNSTFITFEGDIVPANGFVDTSQAPASIQLKGPFFAAVAGIETPTAQGTNYTIRANQAGTLTFLWNYTSANVFAAYFSPPSFVNKGIAEAFAGFDPEASDFTTTNQSGSGSYNFAANDLFGFQVDCLICSDEIVSIAISNFLFTPAYVPPIPPYIIPGRNATASNPYSTTFAGGTMVVDIPGIFATSFNTGIGGTVDINGMSSLFTGVFSGPGYLSFVNSSQGGFVALEGSSTYTGLTTVGPGVQLYVNGSIATSSGLTIQSGGFVGGIGNLPQTNLVPGAILSPGNSIGTLTATGLSLNGGAIVVELQGPRSDRVNVTGNVTNFTGTAYLVASGGGTPWPSLDYTIVAAPASTNFATFNSLTLNTFGVSSALLRYGTTLVQEADGNPRTFDVQWRPRNGVGATSSALQVLGQGHSNAQAASGVFDRVFQSLAFNAANNANNTGFPIGTTGFTTGQAAAAGLSPDILFATSQLLDLPTGSQLTAAVASLSPESYAAFQSVGLNTLKRQRELLLAQAGHCRTTGWVVNTPASKEGKPTRHPFCLFAQGANATSSIRGQNGLASYDAGIFSTYYGIEYQPGNRWTLGAAYGYGTSNLSAMAPSNGSVSSKVNSGSLYGVYKPSPAWTVRGFFGYGSFKLDGSRSLSFIGNGSPITANPSANGITLALNADVLIPLTRPNAKTPIYIKPLLGVAWGRYQQSSFLESGSGVLNMNVQGHTSNSLLGTIGAELTTAPISLSSTDTVAITPRLAVAYQVDALAANRNNTSVTASLTGAPAAGSFPTQGENRGTNTLMVDAGVDLKVSKNASLYASVGYEIFSTGSQVSYGGGLKLSF